MKIYEHCVVHGRVNLIRFDEVLMLKTSAFVSLYGGQFTLSTQVDQTQLTLRQCFCKAFRNLSEIAIIVSNKKETKNLNSHYALWNKILETFTISLSKAKKTIGTRKGNLNLKKPSTWCRAQFFF